MKSKFKRIHAQAGTGKSPSSITGLPNANDNVIRFSDGTFAYDAGNGKYFNYTTKTMYHADGTPYDVDYNTPSNTPSNTGKVASVNPSTDTGIVKNTIDTTEIIDASTDALAGATSGIDEATTPTKQNDNEQILKYINSGLMGATAIGNMIGNNKLKDQENAQIMHSLEPEYFQNTNEGLNNVPMYTQAGGEFDGFAHPAFYGNISVQQAPNSIFAAGGLSTNKAAKMLHEGKFDSDKQRRYFAWVAGGKKNARQAGGYGGIVDYLDKHQKRSDKKSRGELFYSIYGNKEVYKGTAEQNIRLMNDLQQSEENSNDIVPAEQATATKRVGLGAVGAVAKSVKKTPPVKYKVGEGARQVGDDTEQVIDIKALTAERKRNSISGNDQVDYFIDKDLKANGKYWVQDKASHTIFYGDNNTHRQTKVGMGKNDDPIATTYITSKTVDEIDALEKSGKTAKATKLKVTPLGSKPLLYKDDMYGEPGFWLGYGDDQAAAHVVYGKTEDPAEYARRMELMKKGKLNVSYGCTNIDADGKCMDGKSPLADIVSRFSHNRAKPDTARLIDTRFPFHINDSLLRVPARPQPNQKKTGGCDDCGHSLVRQTGGGDQITQLIQTYAQLTGQDPQQIVQQLQQMNPDDQQQALQEISQAVQQGLQQGQDTQQSATAQTGTSRVKQPLMNPSYRMIPGTQQPLTPAEKDSIIQSWMNPKPTADSTSKNVKRVKGQAGTKSSKKAGGNHKMLYQSGGMPTITGLPDELDQFADVNAEAGEVIKTQSGGIVKVSDSANTHEQGGENIPNVSRVLEATSTKRKDKASKALLIQPDTITDAFGFKPKSATSHAKTFENVKKELEKTHKIYSTADKDANQLKELNKTTMNSLKLNDMFRGQLPTENDVFDLLYHHQEGVKAMHGINDDGSMMKTGGMNYAQTGGDGKSAEGAVRRPRYRQPGESAEQFRERLSKWVYDPKKGRWFNTNNTSGDGGGDGTTAEGAVRRPRNRMPGETDDQFHARMRGWVYDKNKDRWFNTNKPGSGGSTSTGNNVTTPQTGVASDEPTGWMAKPKTLDEAVVLSKKARKLPGFSSRAETFNNIKLPGETDAQFQARMDINNPKKSYFDKTGQHLIVPGDRNAVDEIGSASPGAASNSTGTSSKVTGPGGSKTQPKNGFHEPTYWSDLIGPLSGLVDSFRRSPELYSPTEFHKLRYKMLDPTATLMANQADFNAAVDTSNQLPGQGLSGAMKIGLLGQKYKANNAVLGQYDNANAQTKNSEIAYNTSVEDKQSAADSVARSQFYRNVQLGREAQRQQALESIGQLARVDQLKRRQNASGNLMSKLSPAFNQTGEYNGYQYELYLDPSTNAPTWINTGKKATA